MNAAAPAAGIPPVRTVPSSKDAVPTRHVVRTVLGQETHVVTQSYTDRVCVYISQVGKLGCVMQATVSSPAHAQPASDLDFEGPKEPESSAIPPLLPSTSLQTLLGSPPAGYATLYQLFASHVASLVAARAAAARSSSSAGAHGPPLGSGSRPVIVAIGLLTLPGTRSRAVDEDGDEAFEGSEEEQARFRDIMQMVADAAVW